MRHATKLKHQSTGVMVDAFVDDLMPLEELFVVEEQWCVTRIRLLRDLWSNEIGRYEWPQSFHWNWAKKAIDSERAQFDVGDSRLFGVEADGKWQGVLLGLSRGYKTLNSMNRNQRFS
jgi:hypothetical protein